MIARCSSFGEIVILVVYFGCSSDDRRNDRDDARDTFKFLKSQRIGDKFACLYIAWAAFETEAGVYAYDRHTLPQRIFPSCAPE